MALSFIPLNSSDTKEFRKALDLPMSKALRYMKRTNGTWTEYAVKNYEISETLNPSGSKILLVTLDNDDQISIMSDYFSEMQKPSFSQLQTDALPEKKGKAVDKTPRSYTVVDLETTGINHFEDDIIEIGAVRYEDGAAVDTLSLLVKTSKKLSGKIISLTGITDELLEKEGIEQQSAAQRLYDFLGDSLIVGHNFSTFDSKFIEDLFEKKLNRVLQNDYVDTLTMAMKMHPGLEHHKLKDIAELYNVDYSNAHRAVNDCVINHFVYEYMAFGKPLADESKDSDELVSLDETSLTGWKSELTSALQRLIADRKLPEKSLSLKGNKVRSDNTVTSYSVCIYEPDLIEDSSDLTRNTIVTRISELKLKSSLGLLEISPKNQSEFDILAVPADAEVRRPQKSSAYMRISMDSKSLIPYLITSIEYALDNYSSKASKFACCSKYTECSEMRRCMHSNLLYAKACAYRKNLEEHKIFYGSNKNI